MQTNIDAIRYGNVYLEMKRAGMTLEKLYSATGIASATIRAKLRGKNAWKLWEGIAIKKALKSTMSLEDLFAECKVCIHAGKREESE